MLPVVAKLLVLLFKDEVYASKVPKRVAALPVNVNILEENKFNDAVCANTLALNEFIEALKAFSDEVTVYKEAVAASKAPNLVAALPVNVNTLEENKFNDAVVASIEALNEFSDAVCANIDDEKALNELVSVNTVLSNPSNVSALAAYDADKAFDPLITPVVVIAPEELIDISVVEPLTKVMLPLLYWITLVRPDAD